MRYEQPEMEIVELDEVYTVTEVSTFDNGQGEAPDGYMPDVDFNNPS